MYKMLWVPDLIFSNEKKGGFHTLTTDNRLLKLKESGEGWIFMTKHCLKLFYSLYVDQNFSHTWMLHEFQDFSDGHPNMPDSTRIFWQQH